MRLICATIAAADPTIANIDVVVADFSSQPVFRTSLGGLSLSACELTFV